MAANTQIIYNFFKKDYFILIYFMSYKNNELKVIQAQSSHTWTLYELLSHT